MRLSGFWPALLLLVSFSAMANWPSWGVNGGWSSVDSWRGPPNGTDGAVVTPTFDMDFVASPSSISALPDTLAETGATLVVSCDARDASLPDWVCDVGGTFTETGGADPTLGRRVPVVEAEARGVLYNGGGYFNGTGTVGALGLEDIAVEVVVRMTTGTAVFAGTQDSGALNGWRIGASGGSLLWQVDTTAAASASIVTGTLSDNAWYHILCWSDRDNATGHGCAINGIATATTNPTAHDGTTADDGRSMDLGASGDGTGKFAHTLASIKVWQGVDMIPSQATTAIQRLARVTGTYATVASGQAWPITASRATTATSDIDADADGVLRQFLVGAGWVRHGTKRDAANAVAKGVWLETQATNLILQSETLGTTWALIDAGDTLNTDSVAGPDGRSTLEGIIADATDGQHGVTQAITLGAATYNCSTWAKAGTQGWLYMSDDTVANATAYFDLDPCAVGARGAGASRSESRAYGDGLCRTDFTFNGTAAAHTIRIGCANADSDNTFAGDGAATACTIGKVQCTLFGLPSSYIATTTATVTRNSDILRYDHTTNWPAAPYTLKTSQTAVVHSSYGHPRMASLGVSPNTAEHLILHTTGSAYFFSQNGTIDDSAGNTNVGTNLLTTMCSSFNTNDAKFFVGAVDNGTDVSFTMATPSTRIEVGTYNGSNQPLDFSIQRVAVYPGAVCP